MFSVSRFVRRARSVFRRRAIEASMDAEMRFHIEQERAERMARGQAPDEALRTAARDFGGVERYKEEARDARGFRALEEVVRDVGHSMHLLRRNPAYTTAAVLTFALGVGFTTSIFSVVNAVLLRPLPYRDPAALVALWEYNQARPAERNVVSVLNFEAWRSRSRSFTGMAALVPAPTVLSGSNPERVSGAEVSPGYFHLLGVAPAVGREPTDEEATSGARVVVLSDGLWRRRFGAAPGIVGRVIMIDEKPFTVAGVMPPGFSPARFGWLGEQDLWLPFTPTVDNRSWGRFLLVVARLRNGVSPEQAKADLEAIAAQRAGETKDNEGWSATVVSLGRQITGDVRRPLFVLLAAVGVLMVMAATNVGSLTLAFARRHEGELAVRRAIGASFGRLFRELLTRSVVVGALGSAAGVLAAFGGTRLLESLTPPGVPRESNIHVDGPVLAFSAALALAATLGFGITAAVRALSQSHRSTGPAFATQRTTTRRIGGGGLVVTEVALGLILTVLAALMARSFVNLRRVRLGFDPGSVVTARVSLPPAAYGTPDRQRAFFDAVAVRMRSLPGVHAVSFATTRPFACCAPATTAADPAAVRSSGTPASTVDIRYVDSSFFPALHVPVTHGRSFAAREPTEGSPRALINQTLAVALWPGSHAVGRHLDVDLNNGIHPEVIGVVGDVHLADARTPPRGTVYLSAARFPSTVRDLIIRADGPPNAIVAAARTIVASADRQVPLFMVTTLSKAVDSSLAQDRFTTLILASFAIVSILLASVGVYGVLASHVASRRKEIGIRIALGAPPSSVVAVVLRHAMLLAVIGAACGIGLGLLAAHFMSSLVFEVGTADPASFLAVAVLLVGVALLATLMPAWRAARVSPLEAIRTD